MFDPPVRQLRKGTHIELDTLYEMERKRKRDLVSSASTTGLEPPVPLLRGDKDRSFFEEEDRIRRIGYGNRRPHLDYVVPKFAVGTHVGFCDNLAQVSGSGKVVRIIKPGERGNAYRTLQGALDPDMEVLYTTNGIIQCTLNVHLKYILCTLRCTFDFQRCMYNVHLGHINCAFHALTDVTSNVL